MEVHITARKVRLHSTVKEHAIEEINKLSNHFDGILRCNATFSLEGSDNNSKIVDMSLHLYRHDIVATEKSDNFFKSIDQAILKLEKQLSKIKSKVREKNKKQVREFKRKF